MFKNLLDNAFTLLLMCFYKVVYMEGEKAGYYLHKRLILWLLLFIPIYFYRMTINLWLEFINTLEDVFSYNSRWITVNDKKPKKLTFSQKKYITKRLMS